MKKQPNTYMPLKKIALFLAVIFLNSCGTFSEPTEEEKAQKENLTSIQQYVSTNQLTTQVTASGLNYFITDSKPESKKATIGDLIKVRYQGKLLDGRVYDDYSSEDFEFIGGVEDSRAIIGLNELVGLLRVGEKATGILPYYLAHGNALYRGNTGITLPPYTPVVIEVNFNSAQNEEEQITTYINNNKQSFTKTASGLYYRTLIEGTGAVAEDRRIAQVKYIGRFLDGEVFDQALVQPFIFTVGGGDVIAGWEEGIKLMKVGGKALFIIPSSLAYGEKGNASIPPYTPLLFEIEFVSTNN